MCCCMLAMSAPGHIAAKGMGAGLSAARESGHGGWYLDVKPAHDDSAALENASGLFRSSPHGAECHHAFLLRRACPPLTKPDMRLPGRWSGFDKAGHAPPREVVRI